MTEHAERRRFHRVSVADSPDSVTGRIRPGLRVRVLDLSPGGGLIETSARLLPGSSVDLQLESSPMALQPGVRDARTLIRATVVRCCIGGLSPERIVFRGALQFDEPRSTATGDILGELGQRRAAPHPVE